MTGTVAVTDVEPDVPPDRTAILLAGAKPDWRIIEIGPSHAPIAPRSAGWNTTVVDHADQAGLIAKYASDRLFDTSRIEPVDVVWAGGPLDAAVPAALHGSFDLLIASHVIEHFPDPIGVLKSAQTLLRPDGGTVSLAVPDKRVCFDFFRPPSTTGQLLAAHRQGRSRHTAASMFDQAAYLAQLDGRIGWGWHEGTAEVRADGGLVHAYEAFSKASEDPGSDYADCHGWMYTPASFELAILEIAAVGVIDLRVDRIEPQGGVEFLVHLKRGRAQFGSVEALESRRRELMAQMVRDLHAQTKLFVEGPAPPEPPRPTPPQPTAAEALRDLVRAVVPLSLRTQVARCRGRIE
ncbi:MAG: hypothetical protein RLZZ187_3728 [Pseudomonadota bacterium]|jgi:SAM-dependent methyltransferase